MLTLISDGGAGSMYQIEMQDENILVQKVETKNTTEFDMGGNADKQGAIFKICHAPAESKFKANELVLLRPETYPGFYFEQETFTVITESDILAKLTKGKK